MCSGKANEHGHSCVGNSEDREAKYRLSDGRDAREIVREVEAAAEREAVRLSPLPNWAGFLIPLVVSGDLLDAGGALVGEDRKKVTDAAVEKWVSEPPSQHSERVLKCWHEYRSGEGLPRSFAEGFGEAFRELIVGRDRLSNGTKAGDTAAAFLERAEQLEASGLVEPGEAVARAGREVLGDLNAADRREILERALQIEERRLDAGGAEREVLERSHHWRKLVGLRHLEGKDKDQSR